MNRLALIVSAALAAVSVRTQAPSSATAPAPSSAGYPSLQAEFLNQLHHIDEIEMALGRLAEQKAQSGRVRRYGQLLARDHAWADKRVMDLARAHDVQIANRPLSPEGKAMSDRLQSLQGEAFDQAFVQAMQKGHDEAIELFQTEGRRMQDPNLRSLLSSVLPILGQHERVSKNLQRS